MEQTLYNLSVARNVDYVGLFLLIFVTEMLYVICEV
jgi:hypothetical protein